MKKEETKSQFVLDEYKTEYKGVFKIKYPNKYFINRKKYKGIGRPKKENYCQGIIGSKGTLK